MRTFIAVVLALALTGPALAGSRPSESNLETKLVCPVCHETLDQSTAPVAEQMKTEIRRRIAQGWSERQILDEMVANYGPGVLSTPATHGFDLVAWVLPIAAAAAPSATKTTVNPTMKGTLASTTCRETRRSPSRVTSTAESADRYPGTSGRTHGVITETRPARNATGTFSSIEARQLRIEPRFVLGRKRGDRLVRVVRTAA